MKQSAHPFCIILIGAQGSGKGTLVKSFKDKGSVPIEMSATLREWANTKPKEAKKYGDIISMLDDGDLIVNEAVKEAFEWKIKSIPVGKDTILDGCIRTPEQAHHIIPFLAFSFDLIFIEITCPRFICEERIKFRVSQMIKEGLPVREDDIRPWKVKKRLDTYEGNLPLIKNVIERHFKYKIHKIDGKKTVTEVAGQADAVLTIRRIFSKAG